MITHCTDRPRNRRSSRHLESPDISGSIMRLSTRGVYFPIVSHGGAELTASDRR